MHFLLFVFEMVLVLGGIALVPARSELSPSRNIERQLENSAFPAEQEIFDCEPTELDMNPNLTFARSGFLHRARFVVVNDRIPRTDGHCALCGKVIERGYVRDSQTRLIYCDTQCFPGEADMAVPVIKNRARKVS